MPFLPLVLMPFRWNFGSSLVILWLQTQVNLLKIQSGLIPFGVNPEHLLKSIAIWLNFVARGWQCTQHLVLSAQVYSHFLIIIESKEK